MRALPPVARRSSRSAALPFTPAPRRAGRRPGGRRGAHHHRRLRRGPLHTTPAGPDTPGIVNVARFVVFLAHQFNDRIAFRSELEVEDTKVEGG